MGGNVEEQEPELNLARAVLYVSHSLHSQTRCDLKPGSKSLQRGGQRSEKIKLKVTIMQDFSDIKHRVWHYSWLAFLHFTGPQLSW